MDGNSAAIAIFIRNKFDEKAVRSVLKATK